MSICLLLWEQSWLFWRKYVAKFWIMPKLSAWISWILSQKNLLNMYLTLWHHWHCWLKSLQRLRLWLDLVIFFWSFHHRGSGLRKRRDNKLTSVQFPDEQKHVSLGRTDSSITSAYNNKQDSVLSLLLQKPAEILWYGALEELVLLGAVFFSRPAKKHSLIVCPGAHRWWGSAD